MSLTDAVTVGAVTLIGLGILTAGLWIATSGVRRMRMARALSEAESTPLHRVSDADGLITFDGTARLATDDLIEAPLSGTACLAYTVFSRSRIEDGADDGSIHDGTESGLEYHDSETAGDGDPHAAAGHHNEHAPEDEPPEDDSWTVDGQLTDRTAFAVEDSHDRVTVDPTNAVLSLGDAAREQTTAWLPRDELEEKTVTVLSATDLPTADDHPVDSTVSRKRQYLECRLEPGDDVYIVGGRVLETKAADRHSSATVGGRDWLEISTDANSAVLPDSRRAGSMYLIFGSLLLVPGLGFTLAGLVGLLSTLVF